MPRTAVSALALILALPVLSACGGGGNAPSAPVTTGAAVAPTAASVPGGASSGSFAGTEWEALALGGSAVTSAPAPTLSFDRSGRVSASGGCNSYSGSVRVGSGGIAFDDAFAGTSRACAGDLEARDRRMLSALQSAATFRATGERLTLFDASGNTVALLLPAL